MTPKTEHDVCLKDQEWREVHDFIAGTKEYRVHLDRRFDDQNEKLDALTEAVKENYHKNEKRIRSLEAFRWYAGGAVAVIVAVLIPIALSVIK